MGVPVHRVSARTGEGCEDSRRLPRPGQTVGLPRLLGRRQVDPHQPPARARGPAHRRGPRGDDRGRHTTTQRELFRPRAGWVSTPPACRDPALGKGQGIESAFAGDRAPRTASATAEHQGEPGCAVERGRAAGELPTERLESYRKLQRELRQIHLRQDKFARLQEKKQNKVVHKAMREHYRLQAKVCRAVKPVLWTGE